MRSEDGWNRGGRDEPPAPLQGATPASTEIKRISKKPTCVSLGGEGGVGSGGYAGESESIAFIH